MTNSWQLNVSCIATLYCKWFTMKCLDLFPIPYWQSVTDTGHVCTYLNAFLSDSKLQQSSMILVPASSIKILSDITVVLEVRPHNTMTRKTILYPNHYFSFPWPLVDHQTIYHSLDQGLTIIQYETSNYCHR